MCEPTTATLLYAAIATTAVSAGVGAYSAYSQGRTQKAVAANNANIAEMAAADAENRGETAAQAATQQARQVASAQRAAFSARGVDIGEGTASDVIAQTDFFGQADAATARTNGRKEAWNARAQKAGYQMEAASTNPGLNAGLSLLGGAGQVASQWYGYSAGKK